MMSMKSTKQNLRILTPLLLTAIALTMACERRPEGGKKSGSALVSLKTNVKSSLAEGSDPAKLCAYLKSNNYFPSNSYPENTKVLFSSSYEEVEDAAGQGSGVVGSDGYFVQKENVTTQLLLCPGASQIGAGKCLWKINGDDGYAQLAFDIVCNKRTRNGEAVHPGYSSQSANLVSYNGSTAGQSVSGSDAVEVTLKSRSSTARVVFAKGQGFAAVVFQESLMPAGTSEVFIGSAGTAMMNQVSN